MRKIISLFIVSALFITGCSDTNNSNNESEDVFQYEQQADTLSNMGIDSITKWEREILVPFENEMYSNGGNFDENLFIELSDEIYDKRQIFDDLELDKIEEYEVINNKDKKRQDLMIDTHRVNYEEVSSRLVLYERMIELVSDGKVTKDEIEQYRDYMSQLSKIGS